MTAGTEVRIVSGPYWPSCHEVVGMVRFHAPGRYLPVMLPVGGVMVTADVLPGEIEVAA